MMAEKPPNDGHRRTILDPEATHVGVGLGAGQRPLPDGAGVPGAPPRPAHARAVRRQPGDGPGEGPDRCPDYRLAFVTLAQRADAATLTRSQVERAHALRVPEPRLAFVPEGMKSIHVVGTETQDIVRVGPGNDFAFRFTPPAPGALDDGHLHVRRAREAPARRRRGALGREGGAVITVLVVGASADLGSRVAGSLRSRS